MLKNRLDSNNLTSFKLKFNLVTNFRNLFSSKSGSESNIILK